MHYRRWQLHGDAGGAASSMDGRSRFTQHGYIRIRVPGHPLADAYGWVYEHRYIVHEAGIEIPEGWHVHHINRDRTDNRLENLSVVSSGLHRHQHRRLDYAEAARLYLSGLSTTEVAKRIGTDAGNVSRILRAEGVAARHAATKVKAS